MLKIQPFTRYVSDLGGDITIHIGYDFAEVHRCEATEKAYNRLGWSVDFPLLWRPLEHRPYTDVCRDDWGIEPPRMYELGYSHANCGGVCVKQGLGDWRRTLANFPERYEQVEKWERDMRDHPVRQAYAILRDQSNGTVTAKTLEELRGEVEAGAKVQPSLFDFDSILCSRDPTAVTLLVGRVDLVTQNSSGGRVGKRNESQKKGEIICSWLEKA
jgi:hypothetical protein